MSNKFTLQDIGEIVRGIDGVDKYILVTSDDFFTIEELETEMRERFCFDSRVPGGVFCNLVTAVFTKGCYGLEAILTVYLRYDN